MPLARKIAGIVGQRQHLPRLNVQDHHAAGIGLVPNHRIPQFLIGKELDLTVNAQLQVPPIHGQSLLTHGFHDTTQPVLDDTAGTTASCELLVEGQFNPLLPVVFDVGKTNHMGRGLAFRVLTFVFLALVNALEAHRRNLFGNGIVYLTFEPDKCLVFISQLLVQLGGRHVQQLREP